MAPKTEGVATTELLTAEEWAKRIGRQGGKTRASRMTAEQRKESARLAAKARWKKKNGGGGNGGGGNGSPLSEGPTVDQRPIMTGIRLSSRRPPHRKPASSVNPTKRSRFADAA
jgi:hypothetical protein